MPQSSTTTLPDGSALRVVHAAAADNPAALRSALDLGATGAVVVLAGGDDPVDERLRPRLAQVVARGLVRTLRDVAALRGGPALCVVRASGGGVPTLLGRAVADGGGQVRLLGVAPEACIAAPDAPPDAPPNAPSNGACIARAPEAPVAGLSHLLLTPGAAWGDELRGKAELVQALVAPKPAVAGAAAPQPMLLVIGGGEGTVAEVLQAVRRGWPVLLVEGSGGAADALAQQLDAGEAAGDDPAVAEILADGRIGSITLGDKAAGAVEALARLVQRECGGDSVLRLAWQRFGALDRAAIRQQRDFNLLQGGILLLGLLVVAMSVAHSVGQAKGWDGTVSVLRYALIVAPICVAALIAIANRFSPGKRWVLTRASAEALKREIYRYRVRPHRSAADGAREKRLQQAMEDITRRLARTEVNSMGMPLYTGVIPPVNAVASGDDGMSLLDTDRYVRLRLNDQLAYYGNKTAKLDRQASGWQVVAIGVGALGTLLAALGGDWVSWVALTSAMASAAMAYLGYKQIETTLTSYNQTATDLENLLAWWTALLPDEQANAEHIDQLVTTTEQVLAHEQDGWAQNMTNALAALRTRQAEDDRDGQAAAPATGQGQAAGEALGEGGAVAAGGEGAGSDGAPVEAEAVADGTAEGGAERAADGTGDSAVDPAAALSPDISEGPTTERPIPSADLHDTLPEAPAHPGAARRVPDAP